MTKIESGQCVELDRWTWEAIVDAWTATRGRLSVTMGEHEGSTYIYNHPLGCLMAWQSDGAYYLERVEP